MVTNGGANLGKSVLESEGVVAVLVRAHAHVLADVRTLVRELI